MIHKLQYAMFSDFDGTITLRDSTEALVQQYGSEKNRLDEELFISGQATNREVIVRHFATIRPSPDSYFNLLRSIPIDPGFDRFYKVLKSLGGSLTVLTGSLAQAVALYLHEHGYPEIAVFGNILTVSGNVALASPADAISDSLCQKGPCAHCKSKHLVAAKHRGQDVLYIGDGLTDVCAASHADILFAKGTLARHCRENNISFIEFEFFEDIYNYLFE